ncbi:MAG: hypothetical protein ABSH49_24130 [Bryobacteraceae bacterium]
MSERVEYVAVDELVFRYTCPCGLELIIDQGKTIKGGADAPTCPECGRSLLPLRDAFAAYHKLCEQAGMMKLVVEDGKKPALLPLRVQVVIPERDLA